MKKIILSLLVALMATTGANAQETLTVFDGTASSWHYPMFGGYFSAYTKSECIIPASELTAMEGGTITAITFYAKTVGGNNSTFGTANQKVFLKEVSGTTLSSFSGMTDATVVFNGLLPMPTTSTDGYTITFSQGYTYNGGNLLIGVYNDVKGSYNDVAWYGIGNQSSGVSGYGRDDNSLESIDYKAETFLPKTTFTYNPVPAGPTTSGIDWNPSTNSGTFLMPAYDVEVSTELWYKVDEEKTLAENIAAYGTKSDFFLNRTLTANVWNTFASPFAIAAGDMTKYFGAEAKVRELGSTTIETGDVLSLNFVEATSIVAGKPYLVKPTAANVVDPTFEGVNLNAATASPVNTTYVNFVPTLGKTAVTGNLNDILIMTTSNTLVHPSTVGNMKGFRGYFVLHEAAAAKTRAYVMEFGDGETSGIVPLRVEADATQQTGTYDLQGRRIEGQPTQKGVYIVNGKKVIIK